MDFDLVLRDLLDGLYHSRIRYATIGGFALGVLDWASLEEYYQLFGLETEGRELRSRFEHAE